MRITSFRIENFRNLKLAESHSPPDFMVICGGNGCGKSALLNALMTAKERAGAYGNFEFDPRAVSADADEALIALNLEFNDIEREFVQRQFSIACPETDEIVIQIKKQGSAAALKRSAPVRICSVGTRNRSSTLQVFSITSTLIGQYERCSFQLGMLVF